MTTGESSGRADVRPARTPEEERAAAAFPQPGVSFRGGFGPLGRDRYSVGTTLRHSGLLRSSRDVRVATENFADDDIVVLFGREGRDLDGESEHPEEAETVFWPDPRIRVVAQTRLEGRRDARLGDSLGDRAAHRRADHTDEPRLADEPFLTVVVVESGSSDTPTDVDDAVQRAARLIAAARGLPPADIVSPGRFRGPIGVDAEGNLDAET
jgi:hypothetical protein